MPGCTLTATMFDFYTLVSQRTRLRPVYVTVQLGVCLEYVGDVVVGVLINVADFLDIEVAPSSYCR